MTTPTDAATRWLRELIPPRMAVDTRERWRAGVGAALGLLVAAWVCRALTPAGQGLPWLVAPLGASAVLVFCIPGSPLAQPWAVLVGNTVSALVGIACVRLLGTSPGVAGLAVGLAVVTMFALRCLHPPGGASALLMVLAGIDDPMFALLPVALNSLLLVAAGTAYNRASGRDYPHRQRVADSGTPGAKPGQTAGPRFSADDLDAVLRRYNQVLDVSRDDLRDLLEQAEQQAWRRRMSHDRCGDLMSSPAIAVEFGTPLQEAWALLRRHRIKALPVVDRSRRIIGILTLADFMRSSELDVHHGWPQKLRELLRPSPTQHSDKAEVVGQVMTRQVRVMSAERPIADLVPVFSETGHHHLPVIDAEQRLVGVVTQSDLVRALSQR